MIGPVAVGIAVLASLTLLVVSGQKPSSPVEVVPGAVVTQPFGCSGLDLEPVDGACLGGGV